MYQIKDR